MTEAIAIKAAEPALVRRVVNIATPVTLALAGETVLRIADTAMVGRVGAASMAAAAAGGVVIYFLWTFANAVAVATTAVTARREGAGDVGRVGDALSGALVLSVVIGGGLAVLVVPASFLIYKFFGTAPEVSVVGVPYLSVRALVVPLTMLGMSFVGFYKGIGRTAPIMVVFGGMCLVNIGFDYVLIFGKLGFPRLGLMGVAVGGLAANVVIVVAYFVIHGYRWARGDARYRLRWVPWKEYAQLIRIGLPAAGEGAVYAGGFVAFTAVVGRLGTVELAASGAVFAPMSVAYTAGFGLAAAASALVGQGLGAGDERASRRGAYTATALAVGIITILALGYIALAFPIGRALTDDPEVARIAAFVLIIGAITLPFDALNMVMYGALSGAGDTRFLLYLRTILTWGLFVPLTVALAWWVGWRVYGAWIAIGIFLTVIAFTELGRFLRGKWARIKIT
ncbi:MAG: MATE family efflux transporter [Candidatus Coatesbacteria bacterium]|nr:MAG: MATE family efflux transporter [Candidatus Coatesbacteria bacterium]